MDYCAATNRYRIAIDEICALYTNHKLDNNEPITAVGKAAMVDAAYAEGVIKLLFKETLVFQQRLVHINN